MELQPGHRSLEPVTELYAPFDPAYLNEAHQVREELFTELSRLVSPALLGSFEGESTNVIAPGARRKSEISGG